MASGSVTNHLPPTTSGSVTNHQPSTTNHQQVGDQPPNTSGSATNHPSGGWPPLLISQPALLLGVSPDGPL